MIQNQGEDGNKKTCCISRHIWIDKKTKLRFKFAGSLQAEGNSIRRVTINKNLDLARLIFGKNNEDLYRMVEKRIKLQTIIIDKYVEYLNSGKFYEISEKAWNTCISSQSIPIVRKYDYGYIQTNADAYDILLKLCESKELQEIETYLKECVEMHHYDNYDKYFEDYFCIDDKKASVNMDKT